MVGRIDEDFQPAPFGLPVRYQVDEPHVDGDTLGVVKLGLFDNSQRVRTGNQVYIDVRPGLVYDPHFFVALAGNTEAFFFCHDIQLKLGALGIFQLDDERCIFAQLQDIL